jgi:hypothetical protein
MDHRRVGTTDKNHRFIGTGRDEDAGRDEDTRGARRIKIRIRSKRRRRVTPQGLKTR